MINPEEDGITHINIYSKGKTQLGLWLSNFTYVPLITEDGNFSSVEGYWYWLLAKNHSEKDKLRDLYGFAAKKAGKLLTLKDWDDSEEFKNKIKKCLLIKINLMVDVFEANSLPFDHYYVYGGKVVKPKECQWIVDYFNFIRENNVRSQLGEDPHEPNSGFQIPF
jgi:hypothetical protein